MAQALPQSSLDLQESVAHENTPSEEKDLFIPTCDEISQLAMTFVRGHTPWEFVLTYISKLDMDTVDQILNQKLYEKKLEKISGPLEIGQFVVCCSGNKLYRAMVSRTFKNGRVRIINVDTVEIAFVQPSMLHKVPREIAHIPFQSILCSVTTRDAKKLLIGWTEDLEYLFNSTLDSCRLSVDIMSVDISYYMIPKFQVKINAFNFKLRKTVNINTWIDCKVLGDLEALDIQQPNQDIVDLLDEECLDPFYNSRSDAVLGKAQRRTLKKKQRKEKKKEQRTCSRLKTSSVNSSLNNEVEDSSKPKEADASVAMLTASSMISSDDSP